MFAELYFSKRLAEITIQDVRKIFDDNPKESDTLEFKSYSSFHGKNHTDKENGVIRTICGFLNSEGGLLIWGAPEEKKDTENPYGGPLVPVTEDIGKDKFIGRVSNVISPTPNGVLFHKIESATVGYIYILEVARSQYPPHQFQHIYWMRLDATTRAAPHHYVEALMKQMRTPELIGHFQTIGSSFPTSRHGVIPFVLSIANISKYIMAFNVKYSIILSYGTFFYENETIELDTNGRQHMDVLAVEVLHYNRPVIKELFLAIPESWEGTGEFELTLLFYSDSSPIKISKYKYGYSTQRHSPTPQIYLLASEENTYSFVHSDHLNQTEEERIKGGNLFFLEKLVSRINTNPMIKKMN